MKKYLSILTAMLCMGLFSCEKSDEQKADVYGPSVLISNYGLKTLSILDVVDPIQQFTIYVEADGVTGGEATVKLVVDEAALEAYNSVNETSYRSIPADCYSIDTQSKTLSGGQAEFVVTFDVEKIHALSKTTDYSDIADYVIPYAIASETENIEVETLDGVNLILVNPKLEHKPRTIKLVNPTSAEVTADAYVIKYKLAAEQNLWWSSDYDFELTLTDKNNSDATLVEGTDYELTCSATNESFAVGSTEVIYTVTLLKAGLNIGSRLGLKAELAGVEGGFSIDGEEVSSLTFEPYPQLSKTDGTVPGFDRTRPATDVCNSFQYANRSGYALIDGSGSNRGEYWGWAWNASGAGWPGHANGHPYVLTFDLTANVEIANIDLWRSNASDGNWKALGKGYIEFSDDRETWGNKVEFDFTGSAYPFTGRNNNLGPLSVPNTKPVSCKYIRFTLTENWTGNGDKNAAFQEIDVYISAPALY